MTKPTEDYEWAESQTDPTRVTDPSALRSLGFPLLSPFASNAANYLFRAVGRWIDFLQSQFDNDGHLNFGDTQGELRPGDPGASESGLYIDDNSGGPGELTLGTLNIDSTGDLNIDGPARAQAINTAKAVGIIEFDPSGPTVSVVSNFFGISTASVVTYPTSGGGVLLTVDFTDPGTGTDVYATVTQHIDNTGGVFGADELFHIGVGGEVVSGSAAIEVEVEPDSGTFPTGSVLQLNVIAYYQRA